MCTHPAPPQVPRKIWRYNFADFKQILSRVDVSSVIVDGDIGASNWETLSLETMEKAYPLVHCPREGTTMVVQIYHSTYAKKGHVF